jgi:uncharacterized protein YbjT (DUF2867 family)
VGSVFLVAPSGDARSHEHMVPFVRELSGAGIKRVVTLTAMGVDANDAIPLRQIELAVEKTGLSWTHVRPTWFMQNCESFLYPTLKEQSAIYLPAGDGKTSFVDVRDIAEVVATVLTQSGHDHRVYTLTGPEALGYSDVAAQLGAAAGKTFRYVAMEPPEWKKTVMAAGMPDENASLMLALFEAVRKGYTSKLSDDVKKLTDKAPRRFGDYARERADLFR